jgi:3-isopropylmalate/(R)-2-methylmalate dehydratase small subunit
MKRKVKLFRRIVMKSSGKAIKYGNNIDTDVIIPARYLNTSDPEELARHCMEDIDKNFAGKVSDCSGCMGSSAIIVAGRNFGCGSSREHAPIAIKASGISCVIAETFARIFYRNAINTGLPILECPEAARDISDGDCLEIEFDSGRIRNLTKMKIYTAVPFPAFMQDIITADGLISYVKKQFQNKKD